MKRVFSSLSGRDWLVVIAGLAVIAGMQMASFSLDRLAAKQPVAQRDEKADPDNMPPPPPEEPLAEAPKPPPIPAFDRPTLFPEAAELRYWRDPAFPHHPRVPPMGDEARRVLTTQFTKRAYFGAFALSANAVSYGWSEGSATVAAAEAVALAHCHQHGPDCRVIAHMLPAGLEGDPPRSSLSFQQAKGFLRAEAQRGPRAYARSLNGAWAYSKGSTGEKAVDSAFRSCSKHNGKQQAFLPQMPCEVIAFWPD
jgi:hypothetical protein